MYGSYELMESKREKAEAYLKDVLAEAKEIGYREAIKKLQAQLDEITMEWEPDIEKELAKWAGVKEEDRNQGVMTDLGVIEDRVRELDDSYSDALKELKLKESKRAIGFIPL